jgi:hypothetical protein
MTITIWDIAEPSYARRVFPIRMAIANARADLAMDGLVSTARDHYPAGGRRRSGNDPPLLYQWPAYALAGSTSRISTLRCRWTES